jgi:DNA-binding winged helix-turn-helix (wHTH) protein
VIYRFGEFELDGDGFELRRDGALLESEPKVLELLLYLVRHAERLVPRDELLAQVWRGVHVEETSLYRAVAIARRLVAQADGADAPIRTVRGRGYRFVAEVATGEPASGAALDAELPGRAEALASLAAALGRARAGERQLVVVSGEAGLGKTRLVETFLASLRAEGVATTTGQCLAPFDGGEPWSPLLEALARLCRRTGAPAVEALRTRAPAWLAQLPGFTDPSARDLFESRARGASRERLIEELADALDEIAGQRPLVVALEDLQACDRATLWLLAALAQRREAAAILVIGTARTGDPASPAEALWKLVGELKARGRCSEIPLHPLAEADVAAVVRARAGGAEPDRERARWLSQRSAGNPLYLHALLDSQASPGERGDVPESLAERIERQIEALDPEAARLLEAASAAGLEFSAAEAAAALGAELVPVEEACDELARRAIFLTRSGVGEWPDGTLAARFRFRHALHREVLAARATPARRREHHRLLAERVERAFAGRPRELGAALAEHFERGGDAAGALRHYTAAVESAARRHAGHEARALAERAIALVPRVPERDAAAAELAIRFALLPVLPEALGFDHPEVEANLARAQALCEARGDGERRLAVLWSRCYARFQAGDADEAVAIAEELLCAARSLERPAFELLAHDALAFSHHKACRIETSLEHAERVLASYDPALHAELAEWIGQDVAVDAAVASAFDLWYLGRAAEAQRRIEETLARARSSGHGFSLVFALCYAAVFQLGAEDAPRARALAEEAIERAEAERLPGHRAFAELLRAASLPAAEGRLAAMIGALRAPMAAEGMPRTTGESGARTLFANAIAAEGMRDLALNQVDEAFAAAERSGERHHVPSLHLLRASLAPDDAHAEGALEAALDSARHLGLPLAQLEAATELARFRARSARRDEARAILAPHVGARAGEPDFPILARARALLAELGA